ncbi:protein phosphatase 2C domain-containing protein [Crossiella sp. SN42]|uniref:protein phosphatase 2C domain-containing protein n=1 Tax=Crossiella sp. SN42 TaxID=2944808 RepID=UPI00207D01CD|nr:protein phosphatase 2C domain-containing protein [Crossiella sp. SN42]MCO1582014.1 protein phosphatase 2C domain-containing protein [Crossiella sp. SN42]
MQVSIATESARTDRANEDFVGVVPGAAVLLDGAGSAGADSGCRHGVAWYSHQLGAQLLANLLTSPHDDLRSVLRSSISAVADMHKDECDLNHPGTPSATVLIARIGNHEIDYLALADSVLLLQSSSHIEVVTDAREDDFARIYRRDMDAIPNGSEEHALALKRFIEQMRNHRNRSNGFWVASANPDAADESIVGRAEVRQIRALALLSDGATRLVDRFGLLDWNGLLSLLDQEGPEELIRRTRQAEQSDEDGQRWPRGKAFDDAAAAYVRLNAAAGSARK